MRNRAAPMAERFPVEDKGVRKPRFSPETRREHCLLKTPLWEYLRRVRPLVLLSVPIIYLCAIPFLLLACSSCSIRQFAFLCTASRRSGGETT